MCSGMPLGSWMRGWLPDMFVNSRVVYDFQLQFLNNLRGKVFRLELAFTDIGEMPHSGISQRLVVDKKKKKKP